MLPFSRLTRAHTNWSRRPRTASIRPTVEMLEERAVPSTVPNDPMFDKLWGMEAIHAPEAWALTTGSTKVVVAVNDTGVDYTHPDLYKNIWLNQDEIPRDIRRNLTDVDRDGRITFWDLNVPVNQGSGRISDLNGTGYIDGGDLLLPVAQGGWADGIDEGNNGYKDDLIGWDFGDNDNDPLGPDRHGTHVAGTIGAIGNNGVGVTGVAWQVQIMPLKNVNDADTGTGVQSTIDAIYYAVNNGARVSNNSYGLPATALSEAERAAGYAAIQYAASKDHLFVAAAHNQGNNNDVVPTLPASFDLPNIISVAATTKKDELANFSNYGATSVDLAAPGVNIASTVPDAHYTNYFGTSMATPHVVGAAALILARNPNLSYAQVKALILDNVDPLPDLAGKTVTGGRLNVFKAVSAAPAGPSVTPASSLPTAVAPTFGQRTILKPNFVEAAIIGINSTIGNRTFDIASGQTFNLIADFTEVNSNLTDSVANPIPTGATYRLLSTFDATQEIPGAPSIFAAPNDLGTLKLRADTAFFTYFLLTPIF